VTLPPWYDSLHSSSQPPYTETSSWGRNAVNGKTSNNTYRIYIIDTGVGLHEDLTNVIARVNASCGTNNSGCPGHTTVGCYPHATHVAGIIAAAYGNKGVAGVDAGAKIFSVDVDDTDETPAVCSIPGGMVSSLASGMDYVMWDLIINGGYQVGLVNISRNDPACAPGGTLNPKMLTLATPYVGGYYYAGAFIAQSAGNNYLNACGYAFGYSSKQPISSDGIMVVGGIDYLGAAVKPDASGHPGYPNYPYAGDDPGSNFGSCVEVWAPSKGIKSTWGPDAGYSHTDPTTWQRNDTMYTNYVFLSGTSMAAPHIIGVAAYLAESQGLSSPAAIEAAVRNLFFTTGQTDKKGLLLHYVQLP
jgi:subtilisin family serine protease